MIKRQRGNLFVAPIKIKLLKLLTNVRFCLRKQPTFGDATTGFPSQMTSEKRAQKFYTDQERIQERGPGGYGVSALVSQTSFRGETSGGVEKCRLLSQAMLDLVLSLIIQQEEPMEWHPSGVTRTRIRVNG